MVFCLINIKLEINLKMLSDNNLVTTDLQKRNNYDSISTETRRMLLKLTLQDGMSIRKASKTLQIKYSTAKTLI